MSPLTTVVVASVLAALLAGSGAFAGRPATASASIHTNGPCSGSTVVGDLAYGFDAAGRRISIGGSLARLGLPATLPSASYNAANQLTSWNGTSLTYDLNGNLTGDGSSTYTWNARGQLTAVSGPTAAAFSYDALGRRIGRTIAGSATAFAYDGADAIQEQVTGSPSSNQLSGGLDRTIRRVDAGGNRELLTDALGSTLALVDGSGAIATSYTYEPYGATSVTGTASANPAQFTGREADGTGLYYYRARYYHPTFGRFLSEDPAGFAAGDPNLYRYVSNDPINRTDPSGLCGDCLADVAFIAWDAWNIATGDRKQREEAMASLGLDILGLFIPGAFGLGHADDIARLFGRGDGLIGPGGPFRWLDEAAGAACSFPADTPVATPEGETAIGDIETGDTVLAYDEATGRTVERAVTATAVHRDEAVTTLSIGAETITTTPNHPFLTEERGWVEAGQLVPGERIVSATGSSGAVFSVTTRTQSADMWDLTVAGVHTFAVGHGGWVVHNQCKIDPGQLQSKFKHASDFGVFGPWNKGNAKAFEKAVREHVAAHPGVQGTLRNRPGTWHLDPSTGVAVFFDQAGEYVSGWKLSVDQLTHFPFVGGG